LDPPTLEERIETLHEETGAVTATHIREITNETLAYQRA
jgi:predicted DNA-binding protein